MKHVASTRMTPPPMIFVVAATQACQSHTVGSPGRRRDGDMQPNKAEAGTREILHEFSRPIKIRRAYPYMHDKPNHKHQYIGV